MADFIINWIGRSDTIWRESEEKHSLWLNTKHFVSEGHLPKCLNTNHHKLRLHTHNEIFMGRWYSPYFQSCPIELNSNDIPNLSEQFGILMMTHFILKTVQTYDFLLINYLKSSKFEI